MILADMQKEKKGITGKIEYQPHEPATGMVHLSYVQLHAGRDLYMTYFCHPYSSLAIIYGM